jgi:transposase
MAIVALGIDLAKNVFALHGVDSAGRAVLLHDRTSRAPSSWSWWPRCRLA